ncbi:unnamed protein product, partial [Scytosiphon promiscuus]
FTATRVDGARALEMGMVNSVVADGQVEREALEMAGTIAARGPLAVRAAKLAIDQGLGLVSAH